MTDHQKPIAGSIAFVCGPYRGPNEWAVSVNIQNAQIMAASLWEMGYIVICPHTNSGGLGGVTTDEAFLAGYKKMLSFCDFVCCLPGWYLSAGARAEVRLAMGTDLDLPVYVDGEYGDLGSLLTKEKLEKVNYAYPEV